MTCHMANPYWPGPLPALELPAPSSCDEARQRWDGCGQLAPNSLLALSECVLQRVEECQHFDDSTGYYMWGGGCVSKTGKGYLIVFWLIWLWTQFQNTAIALFLCPPLSTEVRSFIKSGTLCFQLEVMVKVVFVWYMLAPGRPELWETSFVGWGQVKTIVFTSENRTRVLQSAAQWPETAGANRNRIKLILLL